MSEVFPFVESRKKWPHHPTSAQCAQGWTLLGLPCYLQPWVASLRDDCETNPGQFVLPTYPAVKTPLIFCFSVVLYFEMYIPPVLSVETETPYHQSSAQCARLLDLLCSPQPWLVPSRDDAKWWWCKTKHLTICLVEFKLLWVLPFQMCIHPALSVERDLPNW